MALWLGPWVEAYFPKMDSTYQKNHCIFFFLLWTSYGTSLQNLTSHGTSLQNLVVFLSVWLFLVIHTFFRGYHPFVWVVLKWVFYYHLFGLKQQWLIILLQILRQWPTLTRLLYYSLELRWVFLLHFFMCFVHIWLNLVCFFFHFFLLFCTLRTILGHNISHKNKLMPFVCIFLLLFFFFEKLSLDCFIIFFHSRWLEYFLDHICRILLLCDVGPLNVLKFLEMPY